MRPTLVKEEMLTELKQKIVRGLIAESKVDEEWDKFA
jgi:hypothetical protein